MIGNLSCVICVSKCSWAASGLARCARGRQQRFRNLFDAWPELAQPPPHTGAKANADQSVSDQSVDPKHGRQSRSQAENTPLCYCDGNNICSCS